jgi:hypothetical protein
MAGSHDDRLPRTNTTASGGGSEVVEAVMIPVPMWERHDRTHLEVALRHEVPESGASAERVWEAFYFLPESFRLDATSYEKGELLSDIRSYFRFCSPRIALENVEEEARDLAGRLTSRTPEEVVRELKLFGCSVRSAIMEDAQEIIDVAATADEKRLTVLLGDFLTASSGALASMRSVLGPLALRTTSFERADPEVAKAVSWVDEYLSRVLEIALIDIATVFGSSEGRNDLARTAIAAAVDEARYRQSHHEGPVSLADGSVHDLEQVERRQHALKRFTQSVLWLNVEIREQYTVALHVVNAFAAGIAMAFAVTIAVLYGQPNVPGQLGVWAAVVVVAYMGKDRLKAILQSAFDSLVAARYPDRRWTVSIPDTQTTLAEVAERAGFVERDELPDGVDILRSVAYRDRLSEVAVSESILWHRKTVSMRTDAMRTKASGFPALTDVMRVDVSRWLTHTDDAKRKVTFADPGAGELFESKLPRAYDVIVVYRLTDTNAPDAAWNVVRVVVSRNGIRRVASLQKQ